MSHDDAHHTRSIEFLPTNSRIIINKSDNLCLLASPPPPLQKQANKKKIDLEWSAGVVSLT